MMSKTYLGSRSRFSGDHSKSGDASDLHAASQQSVKDHRVTYEALVVAMIYFDYPLIMNISHIV
jgi:hypothetical protein